MTNTIPRRSFDAPDHTVCLAEDRALKLKPNTVWRFKKRHGIALDQPLSPSAKVLLLEEIDTDRRVHKGSKSVFDRALRATAATTPEWAALIAAAIPTQSQVPQSCWVLDRGTVTDLCSMANHRVRCCSPMTIRRSSREWRN
ncbi:hypothetical protein [Synechococcus sp. CS-205]|uniref:hypothetical protein n=1 Tax=Synechococcus sp. CS-205 TaxID=2847984 RepID=UPI00223B2B57|nr:hypothetical protein [Synechococcus sp. CS-205]MCT0248767.1 hypothetical protein [Synechococcus sp. CS-205]